jgi:SNF2 family DNA or RNA helicase
VYKEENIIKISKIILLFTKFISYKKTIELIKNELLNEGINIKVITGKTKLDDREKIKNEFNDNSSNLDVIVANPQACSESISLHKVCQNSIYYDLNYNTAEFLQSLDRIHRVGGSETKPVFYDFLQYENTIDEKIYKRVFEKANRQMKVIEEDNLIFDINQEDDLESLYNDLKI